MKVRNSSCEMGLVRYPRDGEYARAKGENVLMKKMLDVSACVSSGSGYVQGRTYGVLRLVCQILSEGLNFHDSGYQGSTRPDGSHHNMRLLLFRITLKADILEGIGVGGTVSLIPEKS